MLILRRFPKEKYSTLFVPSTGFFARMEDEGYEEPFWSKHGPELLDISITNWCDRHCENCYRNSNESGKHMELRDYELIMRQAHRMQVMQVALGGGNPNQHPDFLEILRVTREAYGIVPSYTTNGRGLTRKILEASKNYCGAVAVSAYAPYDELETALNLLKKYNIRSNIHFVLDCQSIDTAITWLENPPNFLRGVNAIIFLNYKPVGRSRGATFLLNRSNRVHHFFSLATHNKHGIRVGFDSCSVSGIASYTSIEPTFFGACDSARFSMFISEAMEILPCSFMAGVYEGTHVVQNNMLRIWQTDPLFTHVRKLLSTNRCSGCKHVSICLGGCPVYEEINMCAGGKSGFQYESCDKGNHTLVS